MSTRSDEAFSRDIKATSTKRRHLLTEYLTELLADCWFRAELQGAQEEVVLVNKDSDTIRSVCYSLLIIFIVSLHLFSHDII
jgi:hypothetical protein